MGKEPNKFVEGALTLIIKAVDLVPFLKGNRTAVVIGLQIVNLILFLLNYYGVASFYDTATFTAISATLGAVGTGTALANTTSAKMIKK